MEDPIQRVLGDIDSNFREHLELARDFVRQPSISADGTGIQEMAALVGEQIERLGGNVNIVATPGHPIVYGNVDVGAPRTLLVYGMYDVQPVEGEIWIAPPFGAEVVTLEEHGECVVSRGIMNSKGPLAGFFASMQSVRAATGTLPVNLKFVVEGEEELGSRNLPAFVAVNRDRLAADAAFFPFYSQDRKGQVIMYLGAKGLVFLELTVRGGDWGAPRGAAVHGSNGAWLHNPAWVLVQALSSMLTPDQTRIRLDGIYDDVAPPSAEDVELLVALSSSIDPASHLLQHDAARFKFDAAGEELMRRFLFEPTLNIDGLVAGHHGEGSKTLLPAWARAKVDVRLVPNMDPDRVVRAIRDHLQEKGFGQVEVDLKGNYPWSKSRLSDHANSALLAVYRELGFHAQIWPLIPGSAPFYLFTRDMGIPLAVGGLGHGGHQHSANEYATLEGMRLFEKSAAMFVMRLAEQLRESGVSAAEPKPASR
jgi:acetylornithine deacetylase/succinyl-diaminopimelate desuccinylase-like protein